MSGESSVEFTSPFSNKTATNEVLNGNSPPPGATAGHERSLSNSSSHGRLGSPVNIHSDTSTINIEQKEQQQTASANSMPTSPINNTNQSPNGFNGNMQNEGQSTIPPYFRNASTALLFGNSNNPNPYSYNPSTTGNDTYDEDHEGRVALLLSAAARDNTDRVLSLIRSGLDPSSYNEDRRTALHVAASDGCLNVVQLLLEEGADINAKDRFGHTPLDDSIRSNNRDITDLLRYYHAQHGSIEKLEARLIQACADGNIAEADSLLTSGVSPNCADYDARTPLHLAVAEGNIEICKLLLSKGANPKAEDRWGSSPLSELQRRLARTGKDPMQEVFEEYIEKVTPPLLSSFVLIFTSWEFMMIILLGIFAVYSSDSDGGPLASAGQAQFNDHYPLYMDVHVMIFIGFGYLMVFLRKHGYTSVGVTFLLGAMVIQWYQLTHGFWVCVFSDNFHKIPLSIASFIQADFCAGAVLITFGVILGKASPSQMLFISLIETVFYSLNENIGVALAVSDLGGTMTIHMFGAFFGIAVSLMMTPSTSRGNQNNSSVYHSDIFAMLGTIFLWMYWPSFNAAQGVGNTQARAVINTVLSLSASCVMAFIMSYMLRREEKFAMVDVQNATLAGGVAMGACADLLIQPGSAVAIGALAGTLSVVGFVYIQPWLESRIGLQDTCGVNNLHGMPSILGGFAAVIAASQAGVNEYGEDQLITSWPSRLSRNGQTQAAYQIAYIATSIGIGLASGMLTGLLANYWIFDPIPSDQQEKFFNDGQWWEVPHLEIPYMFDERGEISRGAGNLPLMNPGLVEHSQLDKDGTMAGADGMNDVRLKARYQKMLESKLTGLEEQVRLLKKQSKVNASMPTQFPYYHYPPQTFQTQPPFQPILPPSSQPPLQTNPSTSSFHSPQQQQQQQQLQQAHPGMHYQPHLAAIPDTPANAMHSPYPSAFLQQGRTRSIDSTGAPTSTGSGAAGLRAPVPGSSSSSPSPYLRRGPPPSTGPDAESTMPPVFNRAPSNLNMTANAAALNAASNAVANQQRMEILLQKLLNKIDKIK